MPSEPVESFRFDRVAHLDVLARQAARWGQDHAGTIAAADPEMPGIHNREADNWAPLFAVAEVAGGEWPQRARAAAAASHIAAGDDEASRTELLLSDIRDIFAKREANRIEPVDRIPSADLVAALVAIEGRPWAELGKSRKPLTQNGLARRLKPLGITPENIRLGDKVPKGYLLERFKEAFSRYLGPEGASEPLHRHNADETGTSDGFQTATAESNVAFQKSEKSANDGPCSGVADEKGGKRSGNGVGLSYGTRRQLADLALARADDLRQGGAELDLTQVEAFVRDRVQAAGIRPEQVALEVEQVMTEVFRA